MNEVIYSTTPLQPFLWSFVIISALVIFGVIGVLNGLFRRRERTFLRLARGCSGAFLFFIGVAMAFITLRSIRNGSETINVHLNDKQIATDNCGDNGTCKRYILESQAGGNFYDLDVNEEAYNQAQIDSCYRVTFYPNKGLLGISEDSNAYQSISNITRIETVTCS